MFHAKGDRNGASASLFLPRFSNQRLGVVAEKVGEGVPEGGVDVEGVLKRLDNKYALFAYVVDGFEVINQLLPGDLISTVNIEKGMWKLIQPDLEGRYEVLSRDNVK
jgi:cyclophilin family peptidyl-prolyl cis-trans isomerase